MPGDEENKGYKRVWTRSICRTKGNDAREIRRGEAGEDLKVAYIEI